MKFIQFLLFALCIICSAGANGPFDSSRQNAETVNSYYQTRPADGWYKRYIERPVARYVGRAFGDEFPLVRNSIMDHQNRGYSFVMSHMPWTGWAPKNWKLNANNDYQEVQSKYKPPQ